MTAQHLEAHYIVTAPIRWPDDDFRAAELRRLREQLASAQPARRRDMERRRWLHLGAASFAVALLAAILLGAVAR